jgi:hypothetical protein
MANKVYIVKERVCVWDIMYCGGDTYVQQTKPNQKNNNNNKNSPNMDFNRDGKKERVYIPVIHR